MKLRLVGLTSCSSCKKPLEFVCEVGARKIWRKCPKCNAIKAVYATVGCKFIW